MTIITRDNQQQYYDHEIQDPEFEITRPRGAGRFYTFLMEYKVHAVVDLIQQDLAGRDVLVVCAGSGMDAELLSRFGPRIVCLDISMGALRRAAERARRYGLSYELVTGDAAHLPFPDGAFDYTFVHDGLHHLTDVESAVAEMVRVSRRSVLIAEPADALLSAVAIRIGLMSAFEEASNRVFRLQPAWLSSIFTRLGMPTMRYRRYLLKYYHKPGRLFRLLDLPIVFPLAKAAFLIFGVGVFGRLGNKLAIVAMAPKHDSHQQVP